MEDKAERDRLITALRSAEKSKLDKDAALMRISYSAKEIKRVIARLKSGERELEQALIDIAREAEFILKQAGSNDA